MHELARTHTPLQLAPPARAGARKWKWAAGLAGGIALACLAYFLLTIFVLFNLHEVVPGQVYRSAQPSPGFLERLAKAQNLRTVLKLNNTKESTWSADEAAVAAELGVGLIHVGIGVTELPDRHELVDIVHAVDTAERPLLIHCKTGADRTGLVSAMVRMREGDSFEQAVQSQLKLSYLHFGHFSEAVEDVFTQYRADCRAAGRPTGGWEEFRRYVLDDYYPAFYHATLEPSVASLQVEPGERVRVDVRVTNRSPRPWPRTWGHPMKLMLGREKDGFGRGVVLPALQAGESVTVRMPIRIPKRLEPGTYQFPFDIVHGTINWFGRRGSPVAPVSITVREPAMARSDDGNDDVLN